MTLFLVLGLAVPGQSHQQSIVTDMLTGVAISGYDPVAYFTESEPLRGNPAFEYGWNGVTWYFVSAANRDAFARAPEIYAPQFGGHCAMSMARGYLSDGNPSIFAIYENHLFFFYSVGNREAFATQPPINLARAHAAWEVLPAYREPEMLVPGQEVAGQ